MQAKRILLLMSLVIAQPMAAAVPTFLPRSQSVNAAREIVGWQEFINLIDADGGYRVLTITPEYTQSFRAKELTKCLFGSDVQINGCAASINIAGSRVVNRDSKAWLADYFGLPTDFESTIYFSPKITNGLVDFNYYHGLDSCVSGLYFRIHAPLVFTKWSLGVNEVVKTRGVADYDAGYFSSIDFIPGVPPIGFGVLRADLLNKATDFLSGLQTPTLHNITLAASQCTRNIVMQKLQSSRFSSTGCSNKCLTKTALSDIEFAFGWNFIQCGDNLLGLSLRASAPTGTEICDEFMFAPVIGDGRHWKVGAGLNAQTTLWTNCDESSSIGLFLDARVQHWFKACQTRTFDLCGKPNSRYALAQKLGTFRLPAHIEGAADAGVEFQNEFAPVANLTRTNVKVDVAVEGDVAIKFAYMACNWSLDLGYDFWGRSCERICRQSKCTPSKLADGTTWALKGDASVIGFGNVSAGGACFSLAAVQDKATINAGTNNYVGPDATVGGINGIPPFANPGITNPVVLTEANAGAEINALLFVTTPPIQEITRSSNPVVFITEADVDLSGTKGLSNKIFANFNYIWNDCPCNVTPFLGIGGEVEFAQDTCAKNCGKPTAIITSGVATTVITDAGCNTSNNCNTGSSCGSSSSCNTSCTTSSKNNNCQQCALSQWGVWVKGGVSFN